ncbi:MAG: GGDEF domain-containing protein [Candidatus Riflebacteria bacterium]|nr:GGDEF domain-containing protein [Candidatus Riflebacteria bacterium]
MSQKDDPAPGTGSGPPKITTQIITPKKDEGRPLLIPTIQVIEGPRVGSLHRFRPNEENSLTVGRTTDSQFVLAHPTLSRCHAKLTWMRVGTEFHMLVEDQQSTNGTTVNGKKVDAEFIKDGDRLNLGDVVLRFQMLSPVELAERDRLIAKATQAEQDTLTGLGTRSYMLEQIPKLFTECENRGIPLSLLVLDLDHFKRVNDTLGHQVGDAVLRSAGRIVVTQIRASDTAIRYGGEEMVVFLPGSPVAGARLVAERLRCAIGAFDASTISPGLKITVSVGVAQRLPGEAFEQFFHRADSALYRAKSSGRNRVEADLTVPPPPGR